MTRRERRKRKFELNRLRKITRYTQRRNKKRKNKGRKESDAVYSVDASKLLHRKEFYHKSIADYVLIKTNGIASISIPKDFSIETNPDEVIYILKKIFYCGMDLRIKEIRFDHSKCTNLGIAASTIMDTVVLATKSYRKTLDKKNELTIAGNYPNDEYTKDVFIGSGLVRHLKLRAKKSCSEDRIKTFKLVSGKSGTQESSIVATKLMKYFDLCLKTQNYKLTNSGENGLARMFSEVLDNCEKHGGSNSIWYALGHYQIRENFDYGEIQLTIFNFGNSIYEQLCDSETTIETKRKLDTIESIHRGFFSSSWTKELLFTVFALQDGISRLRDSQKIGFKNRGTGTVTLMNTFYDLGHTIDGKEPALEIVSGRAHIKFNGKYRPETKTIEDEIFMGKPRRIIAFNQQNDIYKPADDNVMLLKEKFPGTIIAMKFYLDEKYLDSLVQKGE